MKWLSADTVEKHAGAYRSECGAWLIEHAVAGFGIVKATLSRDGETHEFTGHNALLRAQQWAAKHAGIGPVETDHRAIVATRDDR